MKLKFLENINEYDEHAIRLNDFDSTQAGMFMEIICDLAVKRKIRIELIDYDFIESVNCRLTLRISETDEGIVTEDFKNFYCDLTAEGYSGIKKLIEPFCHKETDAFQYLYDLDNPIDFIFSAGKETESDDVVK